LGEGGRHSSCQARAWDQVQAPGLVVPDQCGIARAERTGPNSTWFLFPTGQIPYLERGSWQRAALRSRCHPLGKPDDLRVHGSLQEVTCSRRPRSITGPQCEQGNVRSHRPGSFPASCEKNRFCSKGIQVCSPPPPALPGLWPAWQRVGLAPFGLRKKPVLAPANSPPLPRGSAPVRR
jgi:hypothetical protein